MKFGLRKKIGNKLGKAKQFAKGKLEKIDSALDSAVEKVYAAGYNTFNTKSKKYLALRVLCLAGLTHIAFESGDGVVYVDDTAIRQQASNLDVGGLTGMEIGNIYAVERNDGIIEIRKTTGEKIIQFEASKFDRNQLKKNLKIETEDEFASEHRILNKRLATVGNKMFVEEYDEKTNKTVSLKEYKEDSDLYSKLNDVKDLVGFINAITINEKIHQGKEVIDDIRFDTINIKEKENVDTIIEVYDRERNECIMGDAKSVIGKMLKRMNFKEDTIESIINTKSEDEYLNKHVNISNVEEFIQKHDKEAVCKVYSKDYMKYLENGEIKLDEEMILEEPNREETIDLIKEEVYNLNVSNLDEYVKDIETMIDDDKKISDQQLKNLYELIIATKNNRGYSQMRKIEREYKKEKKENKELIEQNLAEDETINTIDKERYVEIMNMEITRVLEQMIVEDEMASENKDKMQKLYKDTGYNMSSKKASNNYDKVYEERVTKHEYAATECLKESNRLEKTRDAVNFMSLCEKTTIIFEKEIQDRNFEKTVEQATAASEVIEAGDNIIYGGMENNNEIAREEVEKIDRIMQDMKDEEFIIPGISEEKTEENMTALNPNIFNDMEFDDVVESLEDYGVYAAYNGEKYIGETYVNIAPAEIEQDEEEQFDY